ncbi:cation:dicarboxylate symporter family transporter, partial [Selenomonas massiliensis]|uniref:cation:dicarboxylate symporter family transporter n=1 Tax=Selenomonas massiliensis TaxID=2058293 RepID=UPI00131D4977
METKKFSMGLGTKILIGIIIGLAIGFLSPTFTETISPLGKVFLRMLKMLIVPLVFFSIISGICKMGDVRQLITVGLRFVAYILISSGIAAAAGSFAGIALNVGGGTTEFLSAGAKVESVEYNFINNVILILSRTVDKFLTRKRMLKQSRQWSHRTVDASPSEEAHRLLNK